MTPPTQGTDRAHLTGRCFECGTPVPRWDGPTYCDECRTMPERVTAVVEAARALLATFKCCEVEGCNTVATRVVQPHKGPHNYDWCAAHADGWANSTRFRVVELERLSKALAAWDGE